VPGAGGAVTPATRTARTDVPPPRAEELVEGPGAPAEPERKPVDVLRLITSVGSPIALVTALLLYFGWVRSQAQARGLGADVSVFAMTSQEYVLRSVEVMFALLPLLVLALGLLRLHARLVAGWLSERRLHRLVVGLRWSWMVFLAAAAVSLLAWGSRQGDAGHTVLPLWLLLAVAVPGYGAVLRRRSAGPSVGPRRGERAVPPSRVAAGLVVALLVGLLFWQVERVASVIGTALADDIKRDVTELPAVEVFSTTDLRLTGPQVTRADVPPGEEAAYAFSYTGLHLVQRSGGKYFLVTDGWDRGEGRLIVLPDTPDIRLEFGA
jgi:hypothetical protein